MKDNVMRLDATDLAWLKRELEFVDREQYEILFPENQARALVPSQPNIPEWASAYIWRETEKIGKAKIIGDNADDLPRATIRRAENAKVIKDVGMSYAYTIKEIKRSIALGTHLDVDVAAACRLAIETEVDEIISVGNAAYNLEGILKFSGVTPVTAITKTGGGTNWTQAAKPDELAGDVFKLIDETIAATKMAGGRVFRKYRVVMPDANFTFAGQRRMGDGSDTRILDFIRASEFVESVNAWWRCSGAAANDTDDRMAIYPPDRMVVCALVPQEYTPQEAEKRNLEYVVDASASTGGCLARYLFAIGYMDAIDKA